jgi:membrane protease YdiL (CAAX protease family)
LKENRTLANSVSIVAQHLLFLFLLVAAPIWDYRDTSRLKQCPDSARKIAYYRTLCIWLWVATLVACWAVGFRPLFMIRLAPGDAAWLFEHAWVRWLIEALLAILLALALLPVPIVVWKKIKKQPRKWSSADALKSLSFFLPATWEERRWYAFVCVTAGSCEEILFRGFLLHYLRAFPFSLHLTLAMTLAAIIFGLQHLYQGAAGAASTVVLGMLFTMLFLLTGNLLLPMLFHVTLDLRMLLLLRPPGAENPATQA